MKSSILIAVGISLLFSTSIQANTRVRINMNSRSRTMTLTDKDGNTIDAGTPERYTYTFTTVPGEYLLTAWGADVQDPENSVANGTIRLVVADSSEEQEFTILTHDLYSVNTHDDGSAWEYGTDYTLSAYVTSREGTKRDVTLGDAGLGSRRSVLSITGDGLGIDVIPSEKHDAEGYMPVYLANTVTSNTRFGIDIPKGYDYVLEVPADADVELGEKRVHYVDFPLFSPMSVEMAGDKKRYTYRLPAGQKFNVRVWRPGALTRAFYFTKGDFDETLTVPISLFGECPPSWINHSAAANGGFETGDILLNINPQNHLRMDVGDEFYLHAMRSWQITDTQVDNYFFEPDLHFTILDLDGNPCSNVIDISSATRGSSWRKIAALQKGTVIVLATYDALGVTRDGLETPFLGGDVWSAIWPENTAAFVVSVGEHSQIIRPNMILNEELNTPGGENSLLKISGRYADAECDVFYYQDSTAGYEYTFSPENAAEISMARPTMSEDCATYTGFTGDGVAVNSDGSCTILLTEGRNIVRMTDRDGDSAYQVLTAKKCHVELENITRPGSTVFYPGDSAKIQFSGLFHPANKLAGIYNMSAYVMYDGVVNGTSIVLGANQYTFGSSEKAQSVEIEIPADFDGAVYTLGEGVIQVTGYGDAIGNHRNVNPAVGRFANFTAIAHQTYCGALPEIQIPMFRQSGISLDQEDSGNHNRWFNLSGVEITRPDIPGIYIRLAGDKAEKIRVR